MILSIVVKELTCKKLIIQLLPHFVLLITDLKNTVSDYFIHYLNNVFTFESVTRSCIDKKYEHSFNTFVSSPEVIKADIIYIYVILAKDSNSKKLISRKSQKR